jgi:hypothetical protein
MWTTNKYPFIVMNTGTSCPWFTAAGFKIHVAKNNSIFGGGGKGGGTKYSES